MISRACALARAYDSWFRALRDWTSTFGNPRLAETCKSDLGDARAAYNTAKLLNDALIASDLTTGNSSSAIESHLRELNGKANLPEGTAVIATISHLEREIEKAEHQSRLLQGLLSRMNELGQREAELSELRRQYDEALSAEGQLRESRAAMSLTLAGTTERLNALASRRTRLRDLMEAHARHQQATSAVDASNPSQRCGVQ